MGSKSGIFLPVRIVVQSVSVCVCNRKSYDVAHISGCCCCCCSPPLSTGERSCRKLGSLSPGRNWCNLCVPFTFPSESMSGFFFPLSPFFLTRPPPLPPLRVHDKKRVGKSHDGIDWPITFCSVCTLCVIYLECTRCGVAPSAAADWSACRRPKPSGKQDFQSTTLPTLNHSASGVLGGGGCTKGQSHVGTPWWHLV